MAHYNSDYPNVITTDASTKGLGATLWQEQPDGKLKPIGFASRFLSDTEKKYAINELELLAVVWGLEHFRLYIYGKPINLLTDHQALEPLIKRNRSNKTYSARLTRWLDRLAHFNINVHHIAGKPLALTDYLSRNPILPAQTDDAYDEEYVINNILPHYNFISKYGCLSNQTDQSENRTEKSERKANNKPRTGDTHRRTAIDCLNTDTLTRFKQKHCQSIKLTMDANTINEIEAANPTAETIELTNRWREIVKPGIYRLTGGKWKRYHEPKFLRNERKVIEERLQQIMKNHGTADLRQRISPKQTGGFIPPTRHSEQRTVDPYWNLDRPTPVQHDRPGPSQQTYIQTTPMEEGEIETDTDQDPSILEVPAINWARYVGVKSVQYVKMGHAPKITAEEQNNWDLEQAVRETEKNFSTDLQLLMTETTNDASLLKTLVCLERQQHELIPEEYLPVKKKLSSRFGLVFMEDKIVVPKNLRTTVISLLHKGHPAINKMTLAARHFWWPRITEAIQKKCDSCIPCKMSGKSIKPNIPYTEKNNLPPVSNPNEEIQLDFIGPITENNRRFYILLSIDRFSKWPAASFCKNTDGETAVKFIEQYIQLNGIPKTIRTDKATAFTGRLFRDFCKKHYIKLIYGTPYIHTPTGLVERGVRTLKENLLTNLKAGERFGKALDIALEIMRKTPHTRLKKSAFELHYGRSPNTEVSNLLNLDSLKKLTENSISAKPDTLQVYSFSGAGGVSDQLPMKPKKNDKGVSNYPFLFLEKKHQKSKFESAYMDKPNIAVSGTKHTVTTPNGRIIHKKCISKPLNNFNQDCNNNRGTGPRGPDGRFTKSPPKARRTYILESDNESEPTPDQTDNTTVKKGTFGRGRPVQKRERSESSSPHSTPGGTNKDIGPLTITTNMTDTEINRAISDAKQANEELFIRDENGKAFNNNNIFPNEGEENSLDIDFANNLSSSTELETDVKREEKKVRRSKRLPKTNPIIRYNHPICHDYRNHRRKAELGRNTGPNPNRYGNKQPELNPTADNKQTSRIKEHCDKSQCEDRLPVHKHMDHWRNHRHTEATQNPIGQSTANSEGGNVVEDSDSLHTC